MAAAVEQEISERLMHNDVMSSPKPPEVPTEERIGEMIEKIIFLALCAFLLWGYSTISLSYAYSNRVAANPAAWRCSPRSAALHRAFESGGVAATSSSHRQVRLI